MEPYEVLMRKPYDNKACFEAYKDLLQKPKDEDLIVRVLETSIPVLGRVLGTCFRKVEKDTVMFEEIMERVPFDFYMYISSDNFYNNFYQNKFYLNEESHFSYLWGVFRNKVSNALAVFRKSIPKRVPTYLGPHPSYYSELLPASVNMGIFWRQIPQAIAVDAERLIRFRDEPDYSICRTALETIIEKKIMPWFIMRDVAPGYSLSQVEFLASHAAAVLRKVMFKYRSDFEALRSELGEEIRIGEEAIDFDCIESGGFLAHDSNDTRIKSNNGRITAYGTSRTHHNESGSSRRDPNLEDYDNWVDLDGVERGWNAFQSRYAGNG